MQLFEKKLSTENVLYYAKISCDNEKLSTEFCKLGNKKVHPRISCSIKGQYKSYNLNSRRCSLRLH